MEWGASKMVVVIGSNQKMELLLVIEESKLCYDCYVLYFFCNRLCETFSSPTSKRACLVLSVMTEPSICGILTQKNFRLHLPLITKDQQLD